MTTAVTETTQPTTAMATTEAFGGGFNSQDIALPIIVLRQNSYLNPAMEDFNPGEIVRRPDNVVLAGKGEEVLFVPVGIEKVWRIVDVTELSKTRTIGTEPFTATNARDPLEWEDDNGRYRRDACFNVHILLLDDLKKQAKMMEALTNGEDIDTDDFTLPSRVTFFRSGYSAGKLVNTHFEMCKALGGQSPATKVFALKSKAMKNDQGNWFALDVTKVADAKKKKTPKDLMPAATFWVNTLKTKRVVAPAEDVHDEIRVSVAEDTVTDDDIQF